MIRLALRIDHDHWTGIGQQRGDDAAYTFPSARGSNGYEVALAVEENGLMVLRGRRGVSVVKPDTRAGGRIGMRPAEE
jgi:hypothetical protein